MDHILRIYSKKIKKFNFKCFKISGAILYLCLPLYGGGGRGAGTHNRHSFPQLSQNIQHYSNR